MSLSRNRVFVLLVTILTVTRALTQARKSLANDLDTNGTISLGRTENEKNSYGNAEPYLDYSWPQLQQAVPELRGLRPDPSQDQLPLLLARVSQVIEDLLEKVPNIISHEEVWQTRHEANLISHEEALQPRQARAFNYLILSHPTQNNGRTLEEYRTDLENRRVGLADQNPGSPRSHGFAYAWVLFLPSNRAESRFRYLGQQKIDKHWTFVVAFAQEPDLVKSPGEVVLEGKSMSVLHQGIAWIEQSTFRIIRLRTDLLAPLPSIHLERLTADLHFGEVRISQVAPPLWLPQEVDITSELNQQIFREVHLYSNYRLYTVKTRILPSPP